MMNRFPSSYLNNRYTNNNSSLLPSFSNHNTSKVGVIQRDYSSQRRRNNYNKANQIVCPVFLRKKICVFLVLTIILIQICLLKSQIGHHFEMKKEFGVIDNTKNASIEVMDEKTTLRQEISQDYQEEILLKNTSSNFSTLQVTPLVISKNETFHFDYSDNVSDDTDYDYDYDYDPNNNEHDYYYYHSGIQTNDSSSDINDDDNEMEEYNKTSTAIANYGINNLIMIGRENMTRNQNSFEEEIKESETISYSLYYVDTNTTMNNNVTMATTSLDLLLHENSTKV